MYIIQFNGFTLQNDTNYSINKLDGISRVPTRVSEDDLTGFDGGNIWARKRGMRTITIGGEIVSDDISDYYDKRDALTDAFSIDAAVEVLTITKSDGTSRSVNAKVIETPQFDETEGEKGMCVYEIVLKCEDPLFYESIAVTGTLAPSTPGGTPVPTPVPFPVGGAPSTLTIVNDGDVEGYARFDIQGQIQNPIVTNQSTSESFQITTNILSGETVNVFRDSTGLNVLNGTTNYMSYLDGDLFPLRVGTNTIAFNGSSYDGSALLTVTFYKRYQKL